MSWFPTSSTDGWKKIPSPPPNLQKTFASFAVITTSFFMMQNVAQRLAGTIGLYAGRVLPVTTTLGLAATTASMCGSNYLALEFERFWDKEIDKVPPRLSEFEHTYPFFLIYNRFNQFYLCIVKAVSSKDVVRRTAIGLSLYTVLEGGLFRTTFPSSSIALGAYANTRSSLRSSIVSNSPVANEGQRRRIQQMGKRFGCHQCGNRQLFTNKVFIADHMPPTKRAEELSAAWWRRVMHMKVFRPYLLPLQLESFLRHEFCKLLFSS